MSLHDYDHLPDSHGERVTLGDVRTVLAERNQNLRDLFGYVAAKNGRDDVDELAPLLDEALELLDSPTHPTTEGDTDA